MIDLLEQTGNLAVIRLRGEVRQRDYEALTPALERQIAEHGRLRVLVFVDEMGAVEPSAVIEDLRFDVAHRGDFERCAIVGDRRWQQWAAKLGDLLFAGEVEFFEPEREADARAWLSGGARPG